MWKKRKVFCGIHNNWHGYWQHKLTGVRAITVDSDTVPGFNSHLGYLVKEKGKWHWWAVRNQKGSEYTMRAAICQIYKSLEGERVQ